MRPFDLERYFAKYEFSAKYLLGSSDCESISIGELLDLQRGARADFYRLSLGYTESTGTRYLRSAIAQGYSNINEKEVVVHAGAQEAIFTFCQSYLKKGDHVIVQWPCYQSLYSLPEDIGCEVTRWEAQEHKNWSLDLQWLEDNLRPETAAVFVNFPHNPTGYLPSVEDFLNLVKIVRKHGALLFCDEVYRGLEYSADLRLPSACELYENAVVLGVTSKSYGLAGLRIGWLVSHNAGILEKVAACKDYTSLCNSAPSEFLASIALRNADSLIARNRALSLSNLSLLRGFLQQHPQWSWSEPKAGCIGLVRLGSGENADDLCTRLAEKEGILLVPSGRFGYGDCHVRIGYGRINFPQALHKLESALGGERST